MRVGALRAPPARRRFLRRPGPNRAAAATSLSVPRNDNRRDVRCVRDEIVGAERPEQPGRSEPVGNRAAVNPGRLGRLDVELGVPDHYGGTGRHCQLYKGSQDRLRVRFVFAALPPAVDVVEVARQPEGSEREDRLRLVLGCNQGQLDPARLQVREQFFYARVELGVLVEVFRVVGPVCVCEPACLVFSRRALQFSCYGLERLADLRQDVFGVWEFATWEDARERVPQR